MFGQNNDMPAQGAQNSNDEPASESHPPSSFFNPSAAQQPAAPAPAPNTTSDDTASVTQQDSDAPMIMDDNPTSFIAPSTPADAGDGDVSSPEVASAADTDLLSMKQEALQQLNPLIDHLDQSPEEKFRTVMMMIQASDDQSKIGEAFDAAKQITDDRTRAQALLDVINEINYFTQRQN